MKRMLIAALVLSFVIPAVAEARFQQMPKIKLQIDIPDKWKVEFEGDVMTATTPDEDVGVMLWEIEDAANIEAAAEALDKELSKVVTGAKEDGEPTEGKINGLDAFFVDGTGKIEGQSVEWSIGLIHNGTGKFLVVLGFATTEAAKKHSASLETMIKSVKKM